MTQKKEGLAFANSDLELRDMEGPGLGHGWFTGKTFFQPCLERCKQSLGGVDEFRVVLGAVDGGVEDDLVRTGRVAGGHGPGQGIWAVRHREAQPAHDRLLAEMKAAPLAKVDDPAQFFGLFHRLDLGAIGRERVHGNLIPDLFLAGAQLSELEKFHLPLAGIKGGQRTLGRFQLVVE